MSEVLQWVVGTAVTLLVGLSALWAAMVARRSSPYDAIASRVIHLEELTTQQATQITDQSLKVATLEIQVQQMTGELRAERAARAEAERFYQAREHRLMRHIDKLHNLLAKHVPDVTIPVLQLPAPGLLAEVETTP